MEGFYVAFKIMLRNRYILIGILLLVALLRLVNLSGGDPLGDEVLYGFRAIGMIDFDNAEYQTTPLEWLDAAMPWWTRLSFHDHPPLVLLAQNFFIKIFGENTFAFRFPSAILGILSVYLIYLIGWRLIYQFAGLAAAAALAVTVNHIFISRVGLQESFIIFFILLAVYFFLHALENDRYFIWTGLAIGLGILTKYTAFIVVIILLAYLLLFRRGAFLNKKLWLGALVAVFLASPIIIYNLMLYRTFGHFDFQLSYIFGQNPEVWNVAPGKEQAGILVNRLRGFFPALAVGNSYVFLTLFSLSTAAFLWFLAKNPKEAMRQYGFLFIALVFLAILIIGLIGPAVRFMALLTPFIALSIGAAAERVYRFIRTNERISKILLTAGALAVFGEIFYSFNSQILDNPLGQSPWLYSEIRRENYNWGFSALGDFLDQELRGKRPAFSFTPKYQFLEKVQERGLAEALMRRFRPYPGLIIYDGNILNSAQLWYLDRLQIYHGWPVLKTEEYLKILQEKSDDYFKDIGAIQYFIKPTDKLPARKRGLTDTAALFEQALLRRGVFPTALYNQRSEEVFRIYVF